MGKGKDKREGGGRADHAHERGRDLPREERPGFEERQEERQQQRQEERQKERRQEHRKEEGQQKDRQKRRGGHERP